MASWWWFFQSSKFNAKLLTKKITIYESYHWDIRRRFCKLLSMLLFIHYAFSPTEIVYVNYRLSTVTMCKKQQEKRMDISSKAGLSQWSKMPGFLVELLSNLHFSSCLNFADHEGFFCTSYQAGRTMMLSLVQATLQIYFGVLSSDHAMYISRYYNVIRGRDLGYFLFSPVDVLSLSEIKSVIT